MISYLMRKAFGFFGKKYNYDTTYLLDVSNAYPAKAWRYLLLSPFSMHCPSAAKHAYYAAKVASAHIADCGPCTSLSVAMAVEAGIDYRHMNSVILGDENTMPPEVLLGYKYAHAVHENSPLLMDLIHEIEILYGKRGLWDMSSAVALGEFYPILKRGLGEAKSCLAPSQLAKEITDGIRDAA